MASWWPCIRVLVPASLVLALLSALPAISAEEDAFRIVVSPIAVDDVRFAEEAVRARSAIERAIDQMDGGSRLELVAEVPERPVASHDEALALRDVSDADAVIWGRIVDRPGDHRLMVSLSLVKAIDLYRPGSAPALQLTTPAEFVANLLDAMPYDGPAVLGPWPSRSDDLEWLATTVGALIDVRDGSPANAARKLEPLAATRPELTFYYGLALLRQGRMDAAGRVFRRLADEDPHHLGARLGLVALHHRDLVSFYDDRSSELIHDAARIAPLDGRVTALVLADVIGRKRPSRDLFEEHLWRVCRDPGVDRMSPEARSILAVAATMLDIKRFKSDRLIEGPLQCAALQIDPAVLGHESLVCAFAATQGIDLPACAGWEPDPYEIHPLTYVGIRSLRRPRGKSPTILEVAAEDPELGVRAGLWGLAATAEDDDYESVLDWVDRHLDRDRDIGPSLVAKGLIELAAGRPGEAAETLAVAEVDVPELERDRRRHLALALTAAGRAGEALEVLEDDEVCERTLALAGDGRFVEAYRSQRRCTNSTHASVMEIVSGTLQQDDRLRRLLAGRVVEDLRESLYKAEFEWMLGYSIEKIGWHIDPVTLPGMELSPNERLGVARDYELPDDPRELANLIRDLPSTPAGRDVGFTRADAKSVTGQLSARAESFLEDRERDVWPRNAPALRVLRPRWRRMLATGGAARTAATLERELVANPSDRSMLVQLAAIELLRWNPQRTVAMLELETSDLDELKLKAAASSWLDAPDITHRLLERAREIAPGDAEVLALEAVWLDADGRTDEALERMRSAIEGVPNDPYLWAGLGFLLSGDRKDCAAALEPLERSVSIFPGYGVARARLGYCYQRTERFAQAEEQFRRVLEIEPDDAWTRRHMAWVLGEQGRHGEAAAHLESLLEVDREDGQTWLDLSDHLASIGRYDRAELAVREAIGLGQDGFRARCQLGYVLLRRGEFEEATLELDRALELDAESSWTLVQRGRALAGLGRDVEAEDSFRRAIELEPDDLWRRLELAEFLGYRKRTDDAREVLTEALESARDEDTAARVGFHLWTFGFPSEARRVLQQAIVENPDDVQARLSLGRIYRSEGDPQRVRDVLEPAERLLTSELAGESFDPPKSYQLAYVQALTDRKEDCRGTVERIIETVAELGEGDFYDLGCIAALNGDLDRSLELLDQAIEAGFRDFEWARRDPDLAGLAGDPRLETVLTPR